VTPAIHDAADLPPGELMARLRDLVNRARGGRLRRAELTDVTFSADHRPNDGYTGASYLAAVSELLQRPEEL